MAKPAELKMADLLGELSSAGGRGGLVEEIGYPSNTGRMLNGVSCKREVGRVDFRSQVTGRCTSFCRELKSPEFALMDRSQGTSDRVSDVSKSSVGLRTRTRALKGGNRRFVVRTFSGAGTDASSPRAPEGMRCWEMSVVVCAGEVDCEGESSGKMGDCCLRLRLRAASTLRERAFARGDGSSSRAISSSGEMRERRLSPVLGPTSMLLEEEVDVTREPERDLFSSG